MTLLATLAAAVTAMTPANPSSSLADPLAPARLGKVQCYAPDVSRRTCRSIGAYAIDRRGVIQNTAIVLVAASPAIVLTTVAPVRVKAGAICGVIQAGDMERGTFTIDGEPASAADAATLRRQMAPGYAAILGHEICSADAPDEDGGTLAQVTVDGERRPAMDQRIRWVSPEEGYTVAP